jgi:DNA-binding response OmpR family regulator
MGPEPAKPAASLLVVEDEEGLREMIVRYLRNEGYTVTSAHSGREAIRIVDTGAHNLVITDLLMPEGDGLELIVHIAKKRPRPAVIVMSGGGSFLTASQVLVTAVQLGARAPLVKPFTPIQLLDAVRLVIGPAVKDAGGEGAASPAP